jgi:hypothetical protein
MCNWLASGANQYLIDKTRLICHLVGFPTQE